MGELAALLARARRDARQVRDPLPPALVPPDADAAYAVNAEVAALLGWEPLGWKIAGTTAAVRARLGLDGPIYGRTFRRFALPSPARLPHAELLDPLVECEFFVTLARDLPLARPGLDDGRGRMRRWARSTQASKSRNAASRWPRCPRCPPSSPTARRRAATSSAIGSRFRSTGWPVSR